MDELNILDEYGVSQLEQTKQDLDTMLSYLTEIESKFQSGDLSIRNFDVKAIQGLESFQTIQDSIYNKNQEAIGISKPTKRDTKIYDRNHVFQQVRRGKHGDKIPIADKVHPKAGAISGLKSKAGWAGIAIDTGLNIKENIENEESTSRIIGDAGVDVGIGAVSLGVAGVSTAVVIGILGAPFIIGAVAGIAASSILSVTLNWEGKTGKSISKK